MKLCYIAEYAAPFSPEHDALRRGNAKAGPWLLATLAEPNKNPVNQAFRSIFVAMTGMKKRLICKNLIWGIITIFIYTILRKKN
ncbi:MAG: hypothetical protein MJA84_16100 [Firmicutes bacterium]|nr:hypothetical protein [Bacillota bacterium]